MILKERWTGLDWLFVGAIGVVATAIRAVGLGAPKELVFDEFYYVPDACRFLIQIEDICGPRELTWMHPPLGKWMIAFGMQIVGPTRFGWRLMPLVAGVATIVLLYVAARCLFESRVPAVAAAGLLTFDFMHFVHSRLAMLEIFAALFVTLALVFLVIDRDDTTRNGLLRPWRWAAGAALGAALATKWATALLLPGLAVLVLLWDRNRRRDGVGTVTTSLVTSAIGFIAIPLVAYMASYAGRFDGTLLSVPWTEGSWVVDWAQRQWEMFEYHTSTRQNLYLETHPSASPAWTWILLKRPMAYFLSTRGGVYREVLALGHVLLWPLALVVIAWIGVRVARTRDVLGSDAIILLGFALLYLPWFALGLVSEDIYPYYLVPALPFMYIALGSAAHAAWSRRAARAAVAGVGLAAIALWVFFLPVLSAQPMTVPEWRSRMWFRDCAVFEGPTLDELLEKTDPDLPLQGLEGPPGPTDRLFPTGTRATGWCWI